MKNKHILQSGEWEKVEKAEGKETFHITAPGFSARGTVEKTPVCPYLFTKYGPECEDAKSFFAGMREVEKFAREKGCGFVRVEPRNLGVKKKLAGRGYVKTRDIEPEWTLILPLKSEEQIFSAIEGRKARYWRNYQKKGMRVWSSKEVSDTKILYDFLVKLADKDKFNAYSLEHLENEVRQGFATLYFIEVEEETSLSLRDSLGKMSYAGAPTEPPLRGEPVGPVRNIHFPGANLESETREKSPSSHILAAAMVYDYGGTRYYVHAAKDESRAKLMAGTILLIQMIVDAYHNGAKEFDFWGMTKSEDKNHPWYGFTQYKKSFGGVETEFGGTWDFVLKPTKYRIYRALRAINLRMRKK